MCVRMVKLNFFRTLKSFEAWLRKGGKGTDYLLYPEMAVMMNVIIDCKARVGYTILEDEKFSPCPPEIRFIPLGKLLYTSYFAVR